MRKIHVKGYTIEEGKYQSFEDDFIVDDLIITVQDIFDMLEGDGVRIESAEEQESGLHYVRGGALVSWGWMVSEDDGWLRKVVPYRVNEHGLAYSIAETWE